MEKFDITRVFADREEKLIDLVTKEIPLTIYVNDKELVTLLASPCDLTELAVGFLYTSGFISDYNQIVKISEDTNRWIVSVHIQDGQIDPDQIYRRVFTSGCGRGALIYKTTDLFNRRKNTSTTKIRRDQVFHLMTEFQTGSNGFRETGGVHSSAIVDANSILVIREDIGRHNTIDKVLGYALTNNLDLNDKIILSSGRISSEILLKIQKTQIGVIISRSAPTDQAVKHARDCNLTLIGFVRGRRMNVYSGLERIL